MEHFVYILKCNDDTYYTGYTLDVVRRCQEHNDGIGCKYTRTRRPVELIYCHGFNSRSEAMKEEWRIKHKLSREQKEALINSKENQLEDRC